MKSIPIRSIQRQESNEKVFGTFKIRTLTDVLGGKDMNQELHRHDFYFILVVRAGSGMHEIDFIEHNITDHAIFLMRPGQVHRLQLKAGTEGYLLEFNKNFQLLSSKHGNDFLRKAANRNYCRLKEKDIGALSAILQTMLEEYTSREERFEQVLHANLDIFLIQFLRHRQKFQLSATTASPYQQEKLQEFLDLVETNIASKKQVAVYADMLSLSPFQLNSITKSLLGKTAAELIEEQILLEAKRYLLGTSDQINQIAFHLGFEDVSYFIRFFRKLTGHTPEAFRKNFR